MDRNEGVLKYLDDFPGGVCLVSRDSEERILAVNPEVLRIFECTSEQQFMDLTHGYFRNLVAAEEFRSVADLYQRREQKANYNFWGFPAGPGPVISFGLKAFSVLLWTRSEGLCG